MQSEAFLKTAVASPDFENLQLEGIPDDYSGPTFVKKDFVYNTVTAKAGETTWFLLTPTAAVAFYSSSQVTPSGAPDPTTALVFGANSAGTAGGIFPDAATLFPGAGEDSAFVPNTGEVVEGRLLSHSGELVCLNNTFNQYGSITTLKTPLTRVLITEATGASVYSIMGGPALMIPTISSEANVCPVRDGSYSVAMSKEAVFAFAPILDDISTASVFPFYQEGKTTSQVGTFKGPSVLWDNGFDTIMFRVSVPADTVDQSFILKTWRSWEFKPAASSLAHSIAHASPMHDPSAIASYHALAREMPVAVPSKDNPDFWSTLVSTLHTGTTIAAGMGVPGTKGLSAITGLISNLVNKGDGRRAARRTRRANKRTPKPSQPQKPQNRRRAPRKARRRKR